MKSPRYKDGLYPSCKECRKKVMSACLEKDPMCRKCKIKPHQPSSLHCYGCGRDDKRYTHTPKWRRDSSNDYWCCKCKKEPRTPYQNYCVGCKRAYDNAWRNSRRGIKVPKPIRQKQAARRYIYWLYEKGEVVREPCCLCGDDSIHFHHMDYEPRTRNILHLCLKCHVVVTKKKQLLDKLFTRELSIQRSPVVNPT